MLAICIASFYPSTFNLFIEVVLPAHFFGTADSWVLLGGQSIFLCIALLSSAHTLSRIPTLHMDYLHTCVPLTQHKTACADYLVLALLVVESQGEGPIPVLVGAGFLCLWDGPSQQSNPLQVVGDLSGNGPRLVSCFNPRAAVFNFFPPLRCRTLGYRNPTGFSDLPQKLQPLFNRQRVGKSSCLSDHGSHSPPPGPHTRDSSLQSHSLGHPLHTSSHEFSFCL